MIHSRVIMIDDGKFLPSVLAQNPVVTFSFPVLRAKLTVP